MAQDTLRETVYICKNIDHARTGGFNKLKGSAACIECHKWLVRRATLETFENLVRRLHIGSKTIAL